MRIVFTKLSDESHRVTVARCDGTEESVEVESRSFLRHDLAHYAIELELPIHRGFWGCVAAGASLSGQGVTGRDAQLAESLAGPIQTLFRTDAGPDAYAQALGGLLPAGGHRDLPARVHERIRQLRGYWKATPYGGRMELGWPE